MQLARGGMGPRGGVGIPAEHSKDFGRAVRRLLTRMGPDRPRLLAVLMLAVASVALYVEGPRILGRATDIIVDGVRSGRGIDFAELHRTVWTAVGLYVGAAILAAFQGRLLAAIVQRTMLRLRTDAEAKLHRLPLSHVDRSARGDLLSRVTNDIDNVAQSLQQTLSQMLSSVLQVVGVLVMMFWISWPLALFAAVLIPTSVWLIRFVGSRSRRRFIAQWRHTGMLNAHVEEAFTGHAIVRVFGQRGRAEERFDEINAQLHDAGFGAQFVSGTIQPAMMFLGNLNYVVIAVLGGVRVAGGSMSIGDVQAFIQYSRQFTQPLTQLASMLNVFQSGVASAERVFELLDAEEEPTDAGAVPLDGPPRGRVEFEHVSFSYDPAKPLIHDLSLIAEPGRTVAIVGPTGAGKTTLVNLIMRFYDVDSGASPSTATTSRSCAARTSAPTSAWSCRTPGCSRGPSGRTSRSATRRRARTRSRPRPALRTSTASCDGSRRATTPASTTTAPPCPPARSSSSRSPGRSSPTRRS